MKKETKRRPKAVIQEAKQKKTSTQDHKIPFFKLPTFQGDTLQGDVFIKGVDRAFRSTTMARYLESVSIATIILTGLGLLRQGSGNQLQLMIYSLF